MKSNSNVKPAVILPLGDGSYHYNYNIEEIGGSFHYETVQMWEKNYASIVRAVIREKYSESEEFSLINKYNAFNLGISEDEDDLREYENYLREIARIKEMVRGDLGTFE